MDKDKVNNLTQEREKYRQKAFYLMIEIAFIIALPAAVGFFVGQYLDDRMAAGKFYTLILLLASFIISWVIIIRKYLKFNKHIKEVDEALKQAKQVNQVNQETDK